MRDAILPWAVMAVTILVALGLVTFFRGLLRRRDVLIAKFVETAAAEAATDRNTTARHDLAA